MKGLYWAPQSVTRIQRAVIAVFALVALVAVERFPSEERQPYYETKIRAAKKTEEAMATIRKIAIQKKIPIETELDPTSSGFIGAVISPITSGSGSLISKQTTVNPNFAAVVVHWLKKLDIKPGDAVAVGVSGSFPALNLAVYSAIYEVGADPLIISSVAASQFGANNPKLTWIDMEAALREQGVFPYTSIAVSRGGVGDDAIGLSEEGLRMIDRAIDRSGIPWIRGVVTKDKAGRLAQMYQEEVGETSAMEDGLEGDELSNRKPTTEEEEDAVSRRMRIYREAAGDRNIKAYVNVGGGTVSVGTRVGKKSFRTGINKRVPKSLGDIPSVMGAFVEDGVPAIHLSRIVSIAQEFGLPVAPASIPNAGQGGVFKRRQANRWLAGFSLVAILFALFAAARAPWGARFSIPPTRN